MGYEVYLDTDLTLEHAADFFRNLLNVQVSNRTYGQIEQLRYGVNHGGEYCLLEVIGIELYILVNVGEVQVPERPEYSMYLVIEDADEDLEKALAHHLACLCNENGVRAIVDNLL